MLVVKALQNVPDDLGTVVSQAITQSIELIDEVLCGSDSQHLVTVGSCCHVLPSWWINKTTLVFYLVNGEVR